MRRKLVAGNWKMHGSRRFVRETLLDLRDRLEDRAGALDVVVFPTLLHLPLASEVLQGSALALGAQNAWSSVEGAFTGEVSVAMLAEYGVRFVMVGHSERRQIFRESDTQVADKFVAAREQGLIPVLCLGETLEQRESGDTAEVVLNQLAAVTDRIGISGLARSVIAYEPVWAIGTGRTASPAQAQEVHSLIRRTLRQADAAVADALQIVYGGSVNPGNAEALFAQQDIDGGLVGGASLKTDDFASICSALD